MLATVDAGAARGSSRCWTASTAPPRRPSSPSATRTSTWPGCGRCRDRAQDGAAPSPTQLALMEEYPEYKFLQSQPHLFWMLQRALPRRCTRRSRRRSRPGRSSPRAACGSRPTPTSPAARPDPPVPARQALLPRGVRRRAASCCGCRTSSATPARCRRSCAAAASSTSPRRRSSGPTTAATPSPTTPSRGRASTAREVLAHIFNDYNSQTDPNDADASAGSERVQKDGISTILLAFGYGDGGGGPTRDHLEFLRRATRPGRAAARCRWPRPSSSSRIRSAAACPTERYVGELYFQAHRGTYTSQAKTKRGNRKASSRCARRSCGARPRGVGAARVVPIRRRALDEAWRTVLLQPVPRHPARLVHPPRVRGGRGELRARRSRLAERWPRAARAGGLHARRSSAVTVFNSLSWPRHGAGHRCPAGATAADRRGGPARCRCRSSATAGLGRGDRAAVRVDDVARRRRGRDGDQRGRRGTATARSAQSLENELPARRVQRPGRDHEHLRQGGGPRAGGRAVQQLPDVQGRARLVDAWDIDSMYRAAAGRAAGRPATIEVVGGRAAGRPRCASRASCTTPTMTQEISLRRGSRRVDFATTVDWRRATSCSRWPSRSTSTPTKAIHEIQFGHIRRPNHTLAPVRRRPLRGVQPQVDGAGRGEPGLRGAQRLQVRRERAGQHHQPDAAQVGAGARHDRRPRASRASPTLLRLERQLRRERRGARGL